MSLGIGNLNSGSDIDLTLLGEELTGKDLSLIASELDDTSLPYTNDLSIYQNLHQPDLQENIDRVGKLYP